MSKRKRSRPRDPVAIARLAYERRLKLKDPANWGPNREALALPSNVEVSGGAATRSRSEQIRRYDVFALFHARQGITRSQFDAVRRYQTDLAKAQGVAGAGETTGAHVTEQGVRAAQIDASRRVEAALGRLGPLSRAILEHLSEPEVVHGQRVSNWRERVGRIIGDHRHTPQAVALKRACDQLDEAYREIDGATRRPPQPSAANAGA
jgi:hypothetical protein